MKFTNKLTIVLSGLLISLMFIAACGGDESPPAVPETATAVPATQSEPTAKPAAETSGIVTNDTPVPGSTDGTFSVGEGSEATFTVNEKLSKLPLPNDAVMRTGVITGDIDLSAATAELVIDLHTLESDEANRDRYVRDRLFPSQREATISITEFPDIPETFADGESFTSTVVGNVNVNGTDAEIEFEIEARLDPDRLLVLVKGDFVWADFGLTAPSSRFFVVKDDVHFEVLISAPPK
jgi:hypothetical protein